MNLKNVLLIGAIILSCFSCNENREITYLYQKFPHVIECEGLDKALAHEALFTFQHDIGKRYNMNFTTDTTTSHYFMMGYSRYVHRGAQGSASYREIQRPHTKEVLAKLLNEAPELWKKQGEEYILNHDAEYVSCLVENFTNKDIRETIENLVEVDSYRTDMMAELFRKNISDVTQDPYFAMYLALDTYYRRLIPLQQNAASDE